MTTLNINGRRVKVDDSFLSLSPEQQQATVEEIARGFDAQPSPQQEQPVQPEQVPAPVQAGVASPDYDGGAFRAATEGSHAGLMFGFDDEITAGMLAPIDATIDWFKGDGFDMGRAYTRKQQALDAQKRARREQHPVASIAGEVAGGLTLGGGATKAGLTLAGRPMASTGARIGAGAVEGAGYGALYGAGEAAPGERLEGAAAGGAIGGVAGGALGAVGSGLASRTARKAAPQAPSSGELKEVAGALYKVSELHGVRFNQPAVQHLGANLRMAAGRVNDKLRPKTAGFVDDIENAFSRDMSLETFDEFRQMIGAELKRATPDDARTLMRMKNVMDSFADNVKPGQMTGGKDGIPILNAARQQWARAKKTEIVERILDSADVRQGQFTQSGLANTIKTEMRQLYKQIQSGKVKGFTPEETALVRQMAKGGSTSMTVNLLAKFAPRGPMSITLGQILGSAVPGVGNVAIPLAGHVAGEAADRAALAAAHRLRDGAATGAIQNLPKLSNPLAPITPAAIEASRGLILSPATLPQHR